MSVDTLRRWDLGFDKRRRRTIFPLRDVEGRLQGVSGRGVLQDQIPKYLNYSWCRFGAMWELRGALPRDPPADQVVRFPKSKYLYGEHKLGTGRIAVLMEGQFDVVWTDQVLCEYGLEKDYRPLAFQGNRLMEDQALTLCSCVDDAILFTDNDDTGRKASEAAVSLLGDRVMVWRVRFPPGSPEGCDPGFLARHYPEALVEMLALARQLR